MPLPFEFEVLPGLGSVSVKRLGASHDFWTAFAILVLDKKYIVVVSVIVLHTHSRRLRSIHCYFKFINPISHTAALYSSRSHP